MDECAICNHPDPPNALVQGVYFDTDHLNPEDRSTYFICGCCTMWVLEHLPIDDLLDELKSRIIRPAGQPQTTKGYSLHGTRS